MLRNCEVRGATGGTGNLRDARQLSGPDACLNKTSPPAAGADRVRLKKTGASGLHIAA
jgi:hypothetical protein